MSAVKSSSKNSSSSSSKSSSSEADLLKKGASKISPDDVLGLGRVTESYLCEPEANVYGIDFTRFKIRQDISCSFEVRKSSENKC